jgi:hypothetical protein
LNVPVFVSTPKVGVAGGQKAADATAVQQTRRRTTSECRRCCGRWIGSEDDAIVEATAAEITVGQDFARIEKQHQQQQIELGRRGGDSNYIQKVYCLPLENPVYVRAYVSDDG